MYYFSKIIYLKTRFIISSNSSSPLQLLIQKGIVPMRLHELLSVALQPQEQQPFFTAEFSFRSGLKKNQY